MLTNTASTVYFISKDSYEKYVKEDPKAELTAKLFNINEEDIWRSYIDPEIYYSITGDIVKPLPTSKVNLSDSSDKSNCDYSNGVKEYVTLRRKDIPPPTIESITDSVLNCPIARYQFDDGPQENDDITVYKFPELSVHQVDYLRDLMQIIKDEIYDYESDFKNANFLQRQVVEIGLEEYGNLPEDNPHYKPGTYYLTVVSRIMDDFEGLEEYSLLPDTIDIDYTVEMDADEEDETLTIENDEGLHREIKFEFTLKKKTPHHSSF